MYYLKDVREFSSNITSVLAQCIYNPDTEKMNRLVKTYEKDPTRIVYAYYKGPQDAEAVAIIGLKLNPQDKHAVIMHIAVDHTLRGNGIGGKLIEEIISLHNLKKIEAETDKDAVNFYKSCGFEITSLGEKYPGVERFLCLKIMDLN